MQKTPELEELCKQMQTFPMWWPEGMNRLKNDPRFKPQKVHSYEHLQGALGEIWLDMFLEEMAYLYPGFNIQPDPIQDQASIVYATGNRITFEYLISGKLGVFSSIHPLWKFEHGERGKVLKILPNEEYDRIILLNDLPVVFEMKTGENRKHKEISMALTHRIYFNKLAPVRQYFRKDAGYVVVIPKDLFNHYMNRPPEPCASFQSDGGIVAPFSYEREQFQAEVLRHLKEEGIIHQRFNPRWVGGRDYPTK